MRLTVLLFAVVLCLNSCIKDAPANPEADIESFEIDPKLLTGQTFIDQVNRKILVYLTKEAYETGITPTITISKNATITPASGQKSLSMVKTKSLIL